MNKYITSQNLIYLTLFFNPVYLIRFNIFKIPTNALDLLILATVLIWLWENKLNSILKIKSFIVKNKTQSTSVLLIILGLFVSSFLNNNLPKELSIIKSWFILPLLFGFIIFDKTKTNKKIDSILNTLFYSASFVSIISLFYLISSNLTYDHRLKAFYLSPNHLAMILAPGLLIGVWLIFYKHRYNLFKIILTLNIGLILFFTHSYATWLALFIALFIMLYFLASPKQKLLALVSILTIFLIFFIFENNSEKLNSLLQLDERSSLNSRLMIWKSALKILSDNWLWGIGPGNFQIKYLEYQKYFPLYLEWAVPQPHNLFLAFWLQTGLIGFLGFILLIINFFCQIIKRILPRNDSYCHKYSLIILAIILCTLINGLFDTPYWKNDLSLIFWSIFFLNNLTKLDFNSK